MNFLQIVERNTTDHVDIEGIALDMGILLEKNAPLPADVHGMLLGDGSGDWVMQTNAADPELRKRFTIAHMIGHCVMHADLLGDGLHEGAGYEQDPCIARHNDRISQKEETQANMFAAELLLPTGLIIPLSEKDDAEIEDAARILKCSVSGLKIRMELFAHGHTDFGLAQLVAPEPG